MQRQTTGMPVLLKDKQCIQQITRLRMGKNASRRATPSLSIFHNYVGVFEITLCRLLEFKTMHSLY